MYTIVVTQRTGLNSSIRPPRHSPHDTCTHLAWPRLMILPPYRIASLTVRSELKWIVTKTVVTNVLCADFFESE